MSSKSIAERYDFLKCLYIRHIVLNMFMSLLQRSSRAVEENFDHNLVYPASYRVSL